MPKELARAKVNLCLHVTGQRADAMHLLDSIVVFPNVGDTLTAIAADKLSLEIGGPFGGNLDTGESNLVIRSARLIGDRGASLKLAKNLPIASGIGGGSADAAACIRLLTDMWNVPIPSSDQLAELGADIPVCVPQVATRMSGIGEKLEPLGQLPRFWMVLVNAMLGVETSAVFNAMTARENAKIDNIPGGFASPGDFFVFLAAQRNDMQAAAVSICPEIADVLSAIESTGGCGLARMSGSGGTCFGLYATEAEAVAAARYIKSAHKDWWVVSADV